MRAQSSLLKFLVSVAIGICCVASSSCSNVRPIRDASFGNVQGHTLLQTTDLSPSASVPSTKPINISFARNRVPTSPKHFRPP